MHKSLLLHTMLVSAILLVVLHAMGVYLYFYWIFTWFDVLMHFLGGLTGGLIVVWSLVEMSIFDKYHPTPKELVVVVVTSVLIVALAWEVFEYVYDIIEETSTKDYIRDTVEDIFLGTLGALLVGLFARRFISPTPQSY